MSAEPGDARPPSPRRDKLATPAWRECSLTRAAELESLLDAITDQKAPTPLAKAVRAHLEHARSAASGKHSRWARLTGTVVESARSSTDAAEATLLRIAPAGHFVGLLPSVQACVALHLVPADPRRVKFERVLEELTGARLPAPTTAGQPRRRLGRRAAAEPLAETRVSDAQRNIVVTAFRAASSAALRETQQVRSFRNLLALTIVAMALIAGAVAVVGWLLPGAVPLCFQPVTEEATMVVCPTAERIATDLGPQQVDDLMRGLARGKDIMLVELIGLTAAALAAAFSLRGIRGSSVPYSLLILAAALKLPLGALTAVFGLLLMRAEFIPGLSDLDTSAQILGWALVFGYAQQLLSGVVDRQAQTVLNAVNTDEPKNAPKPPDGTAPPADERATAPT